MRSFPVTTTAGAAKAQRDWRRDVFVVLTDSLLDPRRFLTFAWGFENRHEYRVLELSGCRITSAFHSCRTGDSSQHGQDFAFSDRCWYVRIGPKLHPVCRGKGFTGV